MTHTPPSADRRPTNRTHHGHTFADPYEWLRDKQDAEVLAHLEAENAFTEAMTADQQGLREQLFTEFSTRTQQTDLSVPEFVTHTDGRSYWYYRRMEQGKSYPIHARVPAENPDEIPSPGAGGSLPGEQVLLDGNQRAEGQQFFSLGSFDICPSGNRLLWAEDVRGDERYDVFVRDLDTDANAPTEPELQQVRSALWANDATILVTRCDQAWRSHQIWRHQVGDPSDRDQLVLQEDDEKFGVHAWLGADRTWVHLASSSSLTSQVWLVPADRPDATPRTVANRRSGLDYEVEATRDRLWIVHNANFEDFEVATAPAPDAGRWDELTAELAPESTWTSVQRPENGQRIGWLEPHASHVVVSGRADALPAIWLLDVADPASAPTRLTFEEPVYQVRALGAPNFETDRIRVSFTSLVTPEQVRQVMLNDPSHQQVLKQTQVLDLPGQVQGQPHFIPADYVQERQWVTVTDGTKVPLSIVRHRDTPLDGSAPLVLYAYGSYEHSTPVMFSIPRLSLLDRGFVYAISHIRGGGELGRAWYDNGKMLHKVNTFTDFVDSARWLVEHHYTSPERMVANGASAGGLLMGAVANLAPDLFAGIEADVPFVDALTTMLRPDLPLTVGEWEEWGDPLHDSEVYQYLRDYSPYENIQPVDYPAILATTSLNDTRVFYVEPAKWVAELRHTTTGSAPILLRTEMVAGHGGASGREGRWHQLAFEMAWQITTATAADKR